MAIHVKSHLQQILAAAFIAAPLWAHAGVAIVVGAKSPAAKLSNEQVAQLYLAKSATLPGAGAVLPADLPEGNPIRDAFYDKVTGRTQSQIKAMWARLMFSGAAQPPKALANAAEVKRFVASNPDAIGYIDSADVDASVKVVFSID